MQPSNADSGTITIAGMEAVLSAAHPVKIASLFFEYAHAGSVTVVSAVHPIQLPKRYTEPLSIIDTTPLPASPSSVMPLPPDNVTVVPDTVHDWYGICPGNKAFHCVSEVGTVIAAGTFARLLNVSSSVPVPVASSSSILRKMFIFAISTSPDPMNTHPTIPSKVLP